MLGSAQYYQLPVISIRDAIWHMWNDAEPDSALAKMFPKHRSHPTVDGQKLIAHILSVYVMSIEYIRIAYEMMTNAGSSV